MALFETITDFEPIWLMIQTELISDDNLRCFLDHQTRMHQRLQRQGRKSVVVMDCSLGAGITSQQRTMYAEWLEENDQALRETLLAVAFVIPTGLVRGALTAISWTRRLPVSHTVHRSLDDALRWALNHARECDAPLSPKLRREGPKAFAPVAAQSA